MPPVVSQPLPSLPNNQKEVKAQETKPKDDRYTHIAVTVSRIKPQTMPLPKKNLGREFELGFDLNSFSEPSFLRPEDTIRE